MMDQALQAIVDTLSASIQAKTVAVHGGINDPEELAKAAVYAPSLLLSCISLDAPESPSYDTDYLATLRLQIVTSGYANGGKDKQALSLVEQAIDVIRRAGRWNHEQWLEREGIPVASNLYNANLDTMSIALWAVDWRQIYRIVRN